MAEVLAQHTASELSHNKRNLFQVDTTTTVEEALKLLNKHNILSLPVWCKEKKQFVGIISAMDLLAYVAFASFDYKEELTEADLRKFNFTHTPVKDLIGVATQIQYGVDEAGVHVLKSSATLKEVLDPMTVGIQRLLIHQPDGSYRMLSQTDVVRWLFIHEDELGSIVLKPLEELGLGHTHAHTVNQNAKTLTAIREIYTDKNIDGLAVVDDNGKLIGTLSPSDVRHITVDNLVDVLLPVGEFLRKHNHGQLRRPVTLTKNRTLSAAMAKAVMGHIHRVWVVDEHGKPIGQVTLEDILHKFGPFPFRRLSYVESKKLLDSIDD